MGVMTPPWADFAQPWRTRGLLTQGALNDWIDKDTIHGIKPCCESQQLGMLRGPLAGLQGTTIGHDHGRGVDRLTLSGRQGLTVWQERKANIDIEAALMAGVPARHWTASGLAHVTNREEAQTLFGRAIRQLFEVTNQRGMAKKAAPIAPHGLKARPLRGQGDGTLHAASRIRPHRAWWAWGRVNDVIPTLGQALGWKHAPDK